MRYFLGIFSAFLLTCLGLVGCNTPGQRMRPDATEYSRKTTYAIEQTVSSSLRTALRQKDGYTPEKSGFRILDTGSRSLDARLGLIRMAEKTLDLQYYAMHNDITSNLLIEAVIRAAERGVRVRLLVDDISTGDVSDSLSVLDEMENIEIRVFNPMTTYDQSLISRTVGMITDLPQATKRMHNKALIADNQMAIMGGRNLGDEYFDYDPEVAFKDIDVLTAGKITADISKNFDEFWNNDNSFPIATLYQRKDDPDYMTNLRQKLQKNWDAQLKTEQGKRRLEYPFIKILTEPDMDLVWANAEITADDPMKIEMPKEDVVSEPINRMKELTDHATDEFIIISSYLVPQDDGVQWIKNLEDRGVDVRILTNSLASTDVVAVHTGYRRYRPALLDAGAELYEMRPVDGRSPKQRLTATSTPSQASLHSKVYIIDNKHVFLGSFNFDPRSIALNTEIALVIHSPVIAAQLRGMFEKSIAPQTSYKVEKDKDGDLVWIGEKDKKEVRLSSEPESSFWRDTQTFLFSLLPLEDQL